MTVVQKIGIKLSFGKGQFHFVEEKAKVNAEYYVNKILPNLIEDCRRILPWPVHLPARRALAHTASLAQDWLSQNCPEFIRKEEWPPNSPDVNPLDYHVWGVMLDKYQRYVPKPTNISELKTVPKAIWSDLPQGPIDEAVLSFRKRFQACIKAAGGHFEHAL